MKLKVKAAGTIPTQNYGNYQPSYEMEEDFEGTPDAAECRFRELRTIVERLYSERDRKFKELLDSKLEQVQEVVEGKKLFKIRWYPIGDTVFPSVTSIIHPYGIEFPEDMIERGWTQEDLNAYAMRGTILHDQAETFFSTGNFDSLEAHPLFSSVTSYRSKVITDDKPLSPLDCSFEGFWKKHGPDFEILESEKQVSFIDGDKGWAGRFDLMGKYKNHLCIIDIKTASSYKPEKLEDYFTQCAGYDLAYHVEGESYRDYVIIPLNPSNKCGFGAPIVCPNPALYREKFLAKYKELWSLPGIDEERAHQLKLLKKVD